MHGVVLTCRSRAPQAPADADHAHVSLKHAAAGNGGRAADLAPLASVQGEVGTSTSSDARVQSPTTPSPSPSPTQRSVRFPLPPRLASHEAADRDRAHVGAPSPAKGVHFPDEGRVSAGEGGALGTGEGVPACGGGVQQGQDAHFPASQ